MGVGTWLLLFVVAIGIGLAIALVNPRNSGDRGRDAAADPGPTAEAGWYADPAGRFEQRYWDGARWTDDVTTGGQRSRSPLARGIGRLGGGRLIPGPPGRPRPPTRP